MPRYYFHLTDGKQVLSNHKGIDLPGNAAAREDALALARDLEHGVVMPDWNWTAGSSSSWTSMDIRSTRWRSRMQTRPVKMGQHRDQKTKTDAARYGAALARIRKLRLRLSSALRAASRNQTVIQSPDYRLIYGPSAHSVPKKTSRQSSAPRCSRPRWPNASLTRQHKVSGTKNDCSKLPFQTPPLRKPSRRCGFNFADAQPIAF
jgi:hypothetical protein